MSGARAPTARRKSSSTAAAAASASMMARLIRRAQAVSAARCAAASGPTSFAPNLPTGEMLGAVATEDLSHVRELTVMSLMISLAVDGGNLKIREKLPQAAITILPPVRDAAKARHAITAFFAA